MKFTGGVWVKNNYKKFTGFNKNLDRILTQANGMAALEIRNEAINLLKENSDGPKAVRYMPKRTVNVSAPGDPPNSDTGRLMQSIRVEKDGDAYLVGTNLRYGAYLEFGTKDNNPAARPWLSVAVKNVSKHFRAFYEKAMDNFIKGLR